MQAEEAFGSREGGLRIPQLWEQPMCVMCSKVCGRMFRYSKSYSFGKRHICCLNIYLWNCFVVLIFLYEHKTFKYQDFFYSVVYYFGQNICPPTIYFCVWILIQHVVINDILFIIWGGIVIHSFIAIFPFDISVPSISPLGLI